MKLKCWWLQSEAMDIPEILFQMPFEDDIHFSDRAQVRGFELLEKEGRKLKDFQLYDIGSSYMGIINENQFVWEWEEQGRCCQDSEILIGTLAELEIPDEIVEAKRMAMAFKKALEEYEPSPDDWKTILTLHPRDELFTFPEFIKKYFPNLPELPEDFDREKLEDYMIDKICKPLAIPKETISPETQQNLSSFYEPNIWQLI